MPRSVCYALDSNIQMYWFATVVTVNLRAATSNVSVGNSFSYGGYSPFFAGGYGVCYSIRDTQMFACVTCVRGAPLGGEAAHQALPPQALLDFAAVARGGGGGAGGGGRRPLLVTDAALLRDAVETALLDMHALCVQNHAGLKALAKL